MGLLPPSNVAGAWIWPFIFISVEFKNEWSYIAYPQYALILWAGGTLPTKVKVKCTLVQALRLCTGLTAHRGCRGIALPFHDHGTRRVRVQRHAPAALYPRERPGTRCTGGWVGPMTGMDRCGKSRPTGIRSPDLPALSQSLYRLSYRAHFTD